MPSRLASMKKCNVITIFALFVAIPCALGQEPTVKPFGISDTDLPGVTLATVAKFSAESRQYFTGIVTLAGPLAVPQSTDGFRYAAIFKVGDWRIAAFCEGGSIYATHPCHPPD